MWGEGEGRLGVGLAVGALVDCGQATRVAPHCSRGLWGIQAPARARQHTLSGRLYLMLRPSPCGRSHQDLCRTPGMNESPCSWHLTSEVLSAQRSMVYGHSILLHIPAVFSTEPVGTLVDGGQATGVALRRRLGLWGRYGGGCGLAGAASSKGEAAPPLRKSVFDPMPRSVWPKPPGAVAHARDESVIMLMATHHAHPFVRTNKCCTHALNSLANLCYSESGLISHVDPTRF